METNLVFKGKRIDSFQIEGEKFILLIQTWGSEGIGYLVSSEFITDTLGLDLRDNEHNPIFIETDLKSKIMDNIYEKLDDLIKYGKVYEVRGMTGFE